MADGDAWNDMQEFMMRKNSFREKFQKRKREREGLLKDVVSSGAADFASSSLSGAPCAKHPRPSRSNRLSETEVVASPAPRDPAIEMELLTKLCETTVLPMDSVFLTKEVSTILRRAVSLAAVENLLTKFAVQELIRVRPVPKNDVVAGESSISVAAVEFDKLRAFANECREKEGKHFVPVAGMKSSESSASSLLGKKNDGKEVAEKPGSPGKEKELQEARSSFGEKDDTCESRTSPPDDIMSLLSMQTTRERETKKLGEEIFELLSKPTAKERSTVERFRSQGGAQVQEFCSFGTRDECRRARVSKTGAAPLVACRKLHFRKIIQKHTDESLGDCSFLNTCFHMDTCKYVHYQVDYEGAATKRDSMSGGEETCEDAESSGASVSTPELKIKGQDVKLRSSDDTVLFPAQWMQCDLRFFDMSILGKFAVVMADPPWDIHMELPYGTMSDDEMRKLNIPSLQDDGLIFLWVTGRAMELGRECLALWGYERVDELIWVKTNQLQRIIRTGRTGHWLNHGKEHCLVGMKGNLVKLNRGLDCDVIVAEVRATSHKPDEIYGIIERLSPGTRKIELFGRQHNAQPNWITLGNQLEGLRLIDPELLERFRARYPDGNVMNPPKKTQ